MSTKVVNVYKPSEWSHNCLYQQLNEYKTTNATSIMLTAASGARTDAFISFGTSECVNTSKIEKTNTVTFITGKYDKDYYTWVNLNLNLTNPFT